jgi:cell division protein FtsB
MGPVLIAGLLFYFNFVYNKLMPFNQQRGWFHNLIFNPKTIALIGLVVIVLICIPLVKSANQKKKIDKEIADMKKSAQEMEGQNSELKQMVDYFGSKQYLEEQARLNFGLKKPGEEAVVVNDNGLSQASTSSTSTDDSLNKFFNIPGLSAGKSNQVNSNWQRWRDYFFVKK